MKKIIFILTVLSLCACVKIDEPATPEIRILTTENTETKSVITFTIKSTDSTIVIKNCVLSFKDTVLTPVLTAEPQQFTIEGDSYCELTLDAYYPDGLPLEIGYKDSFNAAYQNLDITAKYMGYTPITFDPSVEDYRDMGTGI